ncbi:cell wall / vacuolar inhibitor of fructosidase 1-like [Vicia villosa]|uniref:cell wall / vacuolar inhibitor of fructosidase 1-like n=1 Tax=Vicia villosa TaxID=3911 RepID=UPI00273BE04D|nr:cell wall / vacuolar inhibitor of fructosidase 1-like [Vicia villosa]
MVKSLLLFVLILCTTLVATHSRVIQPNGANIVQQTCSMTPNPALCIQYLNTDPKSSTSDVNGLAQIMFDVLKLKANIAIGKINQLTRSIPTKQNDAVLSCIISYRSILVDVWLSTQALQDGNPNFAVHNAEYAASDVNDCENAFSGKSPLTAENNVVRDASVITSAICKLLL